MVNKGSRFADFVRFRPYTYLRTHSTIKALNLIKESKQNQLLNEQIFFEIGVVKNFAIFRGKHLCWILFLVKLQACSFAVNISKFLRTAFLIKHLHWLLPKNS